MQKLEAYEKQMLASPDQQISLSDSDCRSIATSGHALVRLQQCAKTLDELQRTHRSATLSAVASGALTGGEAIARVDAVRRLDAFAHHAWRSAAHLVGRA